MLGGAGFIGTHLCSQLLRDGYEVSVFGRSEPKHADNRIRYISGDFSDARIVQHVVMGQDYIFHLIHGTNPPNVNSDITGDIKRTVLPTLSFLEACAGSSIKKVLFLSSGGTVYGNNGVVASRENDPTIPMSAYGAHKLLLENYFRVFATAKNLDYTILRLSNPYGPFQSTEKGVGLIAAVVNAIKSGATLDVYGDGGTQRDYIFVSDAVKAMSAAIPYAGEHKIFNIGSGEGRSVSEIISLVEDATRSRLNKKTLPERSFDVKKSVLDISLIRNELNWRPIIGLREGITITLNSL
ncbi:NAD-dependent epimerase/dehydratase family protein [Ochrobactrum sp. BTU1]|uniref:NAD-dependent epimerase/dehydratase family protein n=1 Tax=Ochrobactrum sp. BTU1 TaxID=2840456 RepID=UPI00207B8547